MLPRPDPVLVVDPDGRTARRLGGALGRPFAILQAIGATDTSERLAAEDVTMAVVAGRDEAARQRLAEIARRSPGTVRIALADADDPAVFALEAAGAELFMPETAPDTALRLTARHARTLFRLRRAHDLRHIADRAQPDRLDPVRSLRDQVAQLEARVLRETLIRHGGNKSRTAEALGLSRVGLRAKIARYGLGGAASAISEQDLDQDRVDQDRGEQDHHLA